MQFSIEAIIFYLLLIDSIGANIVTWFGSTWYQKHFTVFARYFPATKGWAVLYLALVLWAGSLLYRIGVLS